MLFIAGDKDHIIPPAAAKANLKIYREFETTTAYKEFSGRSHYILGQDGWEITATDRTFDSGRVGFGSFDNIGRLRDLAVTGIEADG